VSVRPLATLLAALVLALGLAAAGFLVGDGFARSRAADRYVTVKGLAERPVEADLAVWLLRFTATGDELAAAQAKIEQDLGRVRAFLAAGGLPQDAVTPLRLEVVDLLAERYRSPGSEGSRFILTQSLRVRSADVQRVAALSRQLGELVRAGVVLVSDHPSNGPRYLYTRLNDVKPEMIAQATAAARAAATQFARDAGSPLGPLGRADQGVFQILPRDAVDGVDEAGEIEKTVRVVATLRYALRD
jgi:uncharacterized protein